MGFYVAGRLIGFLRPYPWALPALVCLGVFASLSEGIGIGLLIPFLSVALDSGPIDDSSMFVGLMLRYAGGLDESTRLVVMGSIIAALIVSKAVLQLGYVFLSASVNERVNHHLRMSLCRQLFAVGYAFIARSDQGQLFNTIQGETYRAGQALTCLSVLISALCTVSVFLVLLLLISWQMSLVVLSGGLVASLIVRFFAKRGQQVGIQAVAAWDHLAERVMEILTGMRMIRTFAQESRELERFERVSDRTRIVGYRADRLAGMMSPLMEVIYLPLLFAVLAIGVSTTTPPPVIIAFLLLVYRMLPQVKTIDTYRVLLARFSGTVDAVSEMLRRDDKPYQAMGSRPFAGLRSAITFERVGFGYTSGDKALRDFSLTIRKGEMLAVVGRSGSGKSTLVNLLFRLYDPTSGRILVDGSPLMELDLQSWRRRLGLAGQDAELMSGTVRDNIAFGRPEATDEEVVAAARQAHAHEFIATLPDGYASEVGPRGGRLSGGQCQRIGLARALLRSPDVLVLDEATNALDGPTETAIQQTLEELAGKLTMIVVAHRLSTVRKADRVIVLSDGRLVEEGHPAALLREESAFAALARGQQLVPDRADYTEEIAL